MPNIVYLWDFETGDVQGWVLEGANLDGSGALQGTYSLLLYKGNTASISGLDLSTVIKPILAFLIKGRYTYSSAVIGSYVEHFITIEIYEGDTLVESITLKTYQASGENNWFYIRVVVVDLSAIAGKSNVKIVLKPNSIHHDCTGVSRFYIDMIAIFDGADYEYDTGMVVSDNEDKTIEIDIPDLDLSGLNTDRFGISLATPDWYTSTLEAIAITDQASINISTDTPSIKNVNYSAPGTTILQFQKLRLHAKVSIGSYIGVTEKIAVIFLDPSWNYVRLYMFNVHYTFNGISPRFVSSVSTTTYGSTASGYKDINAKIHGNNFDIALKVKIIYGDYTVINTGSIKLEVYSSDLSTKYGELSVDLTIGNEQTSSYLTGLPCGTDLILRITWNINANARVVILVYPLVKIY